MLNLVFLQSGSLSQDALNDRVTGLTLLRGNIDKMWNNHIGTGYIWETLCKFAGIIAFVCLAWLLLSMAKKATSDGDILDEFDKFVLVIFVCILLVDTGRVDAEWARGMRGLAVGINNTVATQLKSVNAIALEFEEMVGKAEADNVLASANKTCRDYRFESQIPQQNQAENATEENEVEENTYESCMRSELEKYQQETQSTGVFGAIGGLLDKLRDTVGGAAELVGYGAASLFTFDDRLKLFRTGIAFNLNAEIAMLITGLFGPIAAAASLMPVGSRAIFAWITGYYTIGTTQIAYTIMVGLLAEMIRGVDSIGDYILPIMIGKSLPLIAVFLGMGGGAALFSALASSGLSQAGKTNVLGGAIKMVMKR